MPTTGFGASGSTVMRGSSQSMDTNQRPALSREAVTVVGSSPSGSARDHTMFRGSRILARVSFPSRKVNAERVYSADALDFLRDLKRGCFARFCQKFANATCR